MSFCQFFSCWRSENAQTSNEIISETEVAFTSHKIQMSTANELLEQTLTRRRSVKEEDILTLSHTLRGSSRDATSITSPKNGTKPEDLYQTLSPEEAKALDVTEILSKSVIHKLDYSTLIPGVSFQISSIFILNDGSKYRGEMDVNCLQHGRGFQFFPDNSIYTGYFMHGNICGQGRLITADKVVLEGEFVPVEEGDTKSGNHLSVLNGYGAEIYPNGVVYTGNFEMGVKTGEGVLKYDSGKYKGTFKNGVFEGKGVLKWTNGNHYEGMFENGLMHGYGEFTCKNGKKYQGEYKFGEKHGNGVMLWSSKKMYNGQWKNGKQHGVGVYTFFDSKSNRLRASRSLWKAGERERWLSPDADQ